MWIVDFFTFVKEWWFLLALIGGGVVSFVKGIHNINKTLTDISHQLKGFGEKLNSFEQDRKLMYDEIKKHDERLGDCELELARHEEKLKTLFKGRGE